MFNRIILIQLVIRMDHRRRQVVARPAHQIQVMHHNVAINRIIVKMSQTR